MTKMPEEIKATAKTMMEKKAKWAKWATLPTPLLGEVEGEAELCQQEATRRRHDRDHREDYDKTATIDTDHRQEGDKTATIDTTHRQEGDKTATIDKTIAKTTKTLSGEEPRRQRTRRRTDTNPISGANQTR